MIKRLQAIQPEAILGLAILSCLLIFWLSMLLPRSDGQLIGSDGVFYYSYLPSVLLDRDFDFTDEYSVFFAQNQVERDIWLGDYNITAKGLPGNQWSIGPAILWSPFFLLAHAAALLLARIGFPIDVQGYGMLHQAVVISANIAFAGVGLWYVYKLAASAIGRWEALIATLLVLFGGTLIYYMTVEPLMAHSGVLMLIGLFCWRWYRSGNRFSARLGVELGVLGGLLALIRPQTGLLLALPFLMTLPSLWANVRAQNRAAVRQWLTAAVVAGGVSFIVFVPQMLVWNHMYGGYFSSGYADRGGQLFYWFRPKLWETTFSSGRGLFIWHPIFLLALVGLELLIFRPKTPTNPTGPANSLPANMLAAAGLLAFLIQWYIISSWNNWWQGYAFGGRMFIVCTPFFVLGLAALVQRLRRRVDWRLASLGALILVGFNLLFVIQYRLVLFLVVVLPSWYDVTLRRITFILELFG